MKYRKAMVIVIPALVVAASALADSNQANGEYAYHLKRDLVEIDDARLKFEINSTDEDGGIQVFLDAEPWRSMTILDPRGRLAFFSLTAGGIGENGGTELFLESGEPEFSELSLKELLKRFPAGEYRFLGRGLEGECLVGTATLTHDLPDGPTLVFPLEGSGPVDRFDLVVMWDPVEPPNGSPIIGHQVLVVQPDTGLAALPKVSLDVMMPPTATSMAVPPGFLLPDTEYEWEVLAIEAGGNQTLSSSFFTTSPIGVVGPRLGAFFIGCSPFFMC